MLPDVLEEDLDVVFCGTAAGNTSAEEGAYYADPSNRFWSALHEFGFTNDELTPGEYECVLDYGIGLTDVVKTEAGTDDALSDEQYDVLGFRSKIAEYKPEFVAFNGKKAAAEVYGMTYHDVSDTADVDYGRQERPIEGATVYVLPSTSGSARRWWAAEPWESLRQEIGER